MLLTALALLAFPQGQVHVVDAAGGPGSDFTTLYPAVTAAVDGDVILVRDGVYSGRIRLLDGKGLTIVAEAGATVATRGLEVQNLPVTSQVLVQGLSLGAVEFFDVELQDNRGPLWFERCSFEPTPLVTFANVLRMTNCDAVVLSRCSLETYPADYFPPTALYSESSRVHVFDSTLTGIAPFQGLDSIGTATLRHGSFLELFGSTVFGGDGYDGVTQGFGCNGLAGGDTVSLYEASTFVRLDSVLVPGAGGDPMTGCDVGPDGREVFVDHGTYVSLPGTARSLEVNSPVREGEAVNITLTGLPGDRVWVKYSLEAGTGISSRFYDGENLLGAQRFRAFTMTLPASGTAVSTGPAPQLAPGQESLVVFCQAFFLDAAGKRFVISSPSACVVLDASF